MSNEKRGIEVRRSETFLQWPVTLLLVVDRNLQEQINELRADAKESFEEASESDVPWEVDRVFLDAVEAEEYVGQIAYRMGTEGKDWRLFSVPAEGDLQERIDDIELKGGLDVIGVVLAEIEKSAEIEKARGHDDNYCCMSATADRIRELVAMAAKDKPACLACPAEVRGLYAVAFNLLNLFLPGQEERRERKLGERLDELRGAVKTIQPFIDAHFADHGDAAIGGGK